MSQQSSGKVVWFPPIVRDRADIRVGVDFQNQDVFVLTDHYVDNDTSYMEIHKLDQDTSRKVWEQYVNILPEGSDTEYVYDVREDMPADSPVREKRGQILADVRKFLLVEQL